MTTATTLSVSMVFDKGFHSYTPAEIKELRVKLCKNQEEFGNLLFVEKSTIAKWEQGKRLPSTPAMRLMQFIEVLANEKHKDINHRIRQAYK